MKNILLTDDKFQIVSAIAALIQRGYSFEYKASSTSLIVEIDDTSDGRINFDMLCERLGVDYNTYVS